MNAVNVLKYGHMEVLKAVDGLAEADAVKPGCFDPDWLKQIPPASVLKAVLDFYDR